MDKLKAYIYYGKNEMKNNITPILTYINKTTSDMYF